MSSMLVAAACGHASQDSHPVAQVTGSLRSRKVGANSAAMSTSAATEATSAKTSTKFIEQYRALYEAAQHLKMFVPDTEDLCMPKECSNAFLDAVKKIEQSGVALKTLAQVVTEKVNEIVLLVTPGKDDGVYTQKEEWAEAAIRLMAAISHVCPEAITTHKSTCSIM